MAEELEFKGTKGEWYINRWGNVATDVEDVAYMPSLDKVNREPNAKLIAAAPDMLDALLRIKKSIESQKLQHYFGHSIQYINEAIEKALK